MLDSLLTNNFLAVFLKTTISTGNFLLLSATTDMLVSAYFHAGMCGLPSHAWFQMVHLEIPISYFVAHIMYVLWIKHILFYSVLMARKVFPYIMFIWQCK